jgi:hypothetical protein
MSSSSLNIQRHLGLADRFRQSSNQPSVTVMKRLFTVSHQPIRFASNASSQARYSDSGTSAQQFVQ